MKHIVSLCLFCVISLILSTQAFAQSAQVKQLSQAQKDSLAALTPDSTKLETGKKPVGTVKETKVLDEFVVTSVTPQMKVEGDTVSYKADTYGATPDATVEDLLKLLPGMEVDENGNIKANGEEVKKVYVDGKEFFGNNKTMATRNLTANMVDDVQVVDMKTEEARMTGVDDGEREKVINLKLKPEMRRGWFGNVNAGWGQGKNIDDRYDSRAMVGQFYGSQQNALTANAGNLQNPGSSPSWNIGVNLNNDKSNRLRDWYTPFSFGGDASYGGSGNDGYNKSHRINFLENGSNVTDSENTSHNSRQNAKAGLKYEKSFGSIEEGMHRIQFTPSVGISTSDNESESWSMNYKFDADNDSTFISETSGNRHSESRNIDWGLNGTYSYFVKTDYGRRRSSITVNVSGSVSESDNYTYSQTRYSDRDTLINQWQDENGSNQTYRVRLTHVEPLPFERYSQTLEFSAQASLTNRNSKQIYYFWNPLLDSWSETTDDGKSNTDYNSDTHTRNVNYTLNASYRIVDDKFNARVGFEVLPQTSDFTDYFDHNRDYHRTYINYAPRAEYTYLWSRHRQIRMTLSGRTQQPSANQLMARKNQTSATHVSLGNIDLDPSYSLNYDARFRNFNEENNHSFEINVKAGASFNNLASKRWYSADMRTDTTMTVNMNGLGSWNASADFRGTYPFADNYWQFTTYTQLAYNESQGYANTKSTDVQINHTQTTNLRQQLGIGYRKPKFQVDVNGNYNLEYHQATIMNSGNLGATHNFGGSVRINARLPYDFNFNTDFNYTGRRGFSSQLARNQSIWNAQITRLFLQKKNLSVYFKMYDILRQRSSFNRNITATQMSDTETRVLGEYFLVGATFRFNTNPGQRGNRNRGGGDEMPMPMPGGGDFGGRGNGGFGGRGR